MAKVAKTTGKKLAGKKMTAKKTVAKKVLSKKAAPKKPVAKMAKKATAMKPGKLKKSAAKTSAARKPVENKNAALKGTRKTVAKTAKPAMKAAPQKATMKKDDTALRNLGPQKTGKRPETKGADSERGYGSGFDKNAETRSRRDESRNADNLTSPRETKDADLAADNLPDEKTGAGVKTGDDNADGVEAPAQKAAWYRDLEGSETSRHGG